MDAFTNKAATHVAKSTDNNAVYSAAPERERERKRERERDRKRERERERERESERKRMS